MKVGVIMKTVRQLIEELGVEYAQICNIDDNTFKGVICHQDTLVSKYQYDEIDKAVYIWIEED